MRISRLIWIALPAMFAISSSAQDASSSLPSAPSATLEQQTPPPPPAPEQKQPELKKRDSKPSAPVLETLDPKPIPNAVSSTPVTSQSNGQAGSSAAPSAATEPTDQTPATVIRSNVNEVNVVFTVTDKHNHYVKDLKAADFKVLDNRMPPASVRNFSSETNLPLRV